MVGSILELTTITGYYMMPHITTKQPDRHCTEITNRFYEAAANRVNKKRHYLGMSSIGSQCERSLWYGFRGFTPNPLDGKTQLIFELGDHIEQIQINWLEKAGYRITNRQDTYSDHNGFFRGHPDGIIHGVTSKPHIYDAKSCNKKALEAIKKLGMKEAKPIYYAQAQMMMHYAELDRAIYIFTCKDNCELYAERFYYNKDEAQSLIDKAKRIITAETAPSKIHEETIDDELDFTCQWCNYNLICKYPEETIMSEKSCGTCYYMGWKQNTVQPHCKHPAHALPIKKWGVCCNDWLYLYHKEIIGKEKYPEKVKI